MNSVVTILGPALAGGVGVAAIAYGQADDAPGLVLFGLLIIGGALAYGLKPSLRSRSRVMGLLFGAIAVTVVGALVAGWLENTF